LRGTVRRGTTLLCGMVATGAARPLLLASTTAASKLAELELLGPPCSLGEWSLTPGGQDNASPALGQARAVLRAVFSEQPAGVAEGGAVRKADSRSAFRTHVPFLAIRAGKIRGEVDQHLQTNMNGRMLPPIHYAPRLPSAAPHPAARRRGRNPRGPRRTPWTVRLVEWPSWSLSPSASLTPIPADQRGPCLPAPRWRQRRRTLANPRFAPRSELNECVRVVRDTTERRGKRSGASPLGQECCSRSF